MKNTSLAKIFVACALAASLGAGADASAAPSPSASHADSAAVTQKKNADAGTKAALIGVLILGFTGATAMTVSCCTARAKLDMLAHMNRHGL